MKRIVASLLLLLSAVASSAAGPIYRCGKTYSQTPCPQGQLLDAADPRTAAQRAAARREAAKEKELAAQMERDRRAREAASAPTQAASLIAPTPPKPLKGAKKKTRRRAASNPDAGRQ